MPAANGRAPQSARSRRRRDDHGIETIEYALITIVMMFVLIVGFPLLTGGVDHLLEFVTNQLTAVEFP